MLKNVLHKSAYLFYNGELDQMEADKIDWEWLSGYPL